MTIQNWATTPNINRKYKYKINLNLFSLQNQNNNDDDNEQNSYRNLFYTNILAQRSSTCSRAHGCGLGELEKRVIMKFHETTRKRESQSQKLIK